MTFIVIGIDGGGSKIEGLPRRTGQRRSPRWSVRLEWGGVPAKVSTANAGIADVVRDALAACEMTHVTPRVLCVGVAGAGREAERQALWQALVARDLASELVIHSDFSIALDDAFGDGPGVLLISGTGLACGLAKAHRHHRALRRLGAGLLVDEGERRLDQQTARFPVLPSRWRQTGASRIIALYRRNPHRGAGQRRRLT